MVGAVLAAKLSHLWVRGLSGMGRMELVGMVGKGMVEVSFIAHHLAGVGADQ
jgi:hypothetical protein